MGSCSPPNEGYCGDQIESEARGDASNECDHQWSSGRLPPTLRYWDRMKDGYRGRERRHLGRGDLRTRQRGQGFRRRKPRLFLLKPIWLTGKQARERDLPLRERARSRLCIAGARLAAQTQSIQCTCLAKCTGIAEWLVDCSIFCWDNHPHWSRLYLGMRHCQDSK